MNVRKSYHFVGSPTYYEMFNQLGLGQKQVEKILMAQPDFESLRIYQHDKDKSDFIVILSPSESGSTIRQIYAAVADRNDRVIQTKEGRWFSCCLEKANEVKQTLTVLTKIHEGIFGSSGNNIVIASNLSL